GLEVADADVGGCVRGRGGRERLGCGLLERRAAASHEDRDGECDREGRDEGDEDAAHWLGWWRRARSGRGAKRRPARPCVLLASGWTRRGQPGSARAGARSA